MTWDADRLRTQVAELDVLLERLREQEAEPGGRLGGQVVQALVDLYGEALARVVALAEADGTTARLLDDELIRHLLLVHGLHPDGPEQRVRRVLDEISPQLAARGASLGFESFDGGVLRLSFDVRGCSSTAAQLAEEVAELVVCAAPEVEHVETVAPPTEPVLVGIDELFPGTPRQGSNP